MQLRCVELTEFTPPPPKSLVEPHTRVFWGGGHTLSLVSVAGSLPIRKSIYLFGGGIFTSPIRNCLSNCAYVLRASGTDLPQTRTESDSSRAELRESRDLAHDCQSRELRSHPTHAGVMTICTVPEMDAGCLGHTHYTLSRTLSGDETSLQQARLQR